LARTYTPEKNLLKKYVDISFSGLLSNYILEAAIVTMKAGITENKDELIAQLLYQGVPGDEIERCASTSAGHISKVLQREKSLGAKWKCLCNSRECSYHLTSTIQWIILKESLAQG
jgi:hypothetical protein